MNEYDQFDAFGGIDDELLKRSEHKAVRKLPIRKLLIAAAAVMALTVTVFAAPKLKELFFGIQIELYHKGIMYVDNENGLSFSKDAAYEVDLTLPCAETAPWTIEEYRLPTYFAENGWNFDYSYVTLAKNPTSAMYQFSVPDAPQCWVVFEQAPFSLLEPRGRSQFLMNAARTGIVVERSITIGDVDGTLYVVEPSEADGDPGLKNVVWSDGTYAYYIMCGYEVTDEMIAGIVRSLIPVEDITRYVTEPDTEVPEEKRLPIDTFYTLTTVPDGYTLTERSQDFNDTAQRWENDAQEPISLFQERVISEENTSGWLDTNLTLADVMTSLHPYEYETVKEDGQLYHMIYQQGDTFTMWETEKYVFMLRFNAQKLTPQEMLEHLRNIQPMPDFTDNLTD